jgi:hypothetical protein
MNLILLLFLVINIFKKYIFQIFNHIYQATPRYYLCFSGKLTNIMPIDFKIFFNFTTKPHS